MNKESIEKVPLLVQNLYSIVNKFEKEFPGRKFTPDGHLIGSIGEVLAAYYYDLELLPASSPIHDAKSKNGLMVQIKATQGDKIALREQPHFLLVIKLLQNGNIEEIYNGPGVLAWELVGKKQSNGQSYITITKLKTLMNTIPSELKNKTYLTYSNENWQLVLNNLPDMYIYKNLARKLNQVFTFLSWSFHCFVFAFLSPATIPA